MQIQKCIVSLEEYYGKFPRQAIRKMVTKYLDNFDENELDILYQRVVLEVSCNRNTTPDVATLEQIRRIINKERTGARYQPIGKNLIQLKRKQEYCQQSDCNGLVLGGVCTKCGWSKSGGAQ